MNMTELAPAGLTSEVAVAAIGNRYDLVLVGARRMRELGRGDLPKIALKQRHSPAVTALLEIEAGAVDRSYLYKNQDLATTSHHRKYQS
jgi:DNA-directed RNA polymerase subunit omega